MCYAGLALKVCSKLGLDAKPATPKNVRHPLHALQLRYSAPQNQLHLANCTCRKSCMVGCEVVSGVASKSLLKVRVRCKAGHAEERAAFRSTIPLPPLRKINCISQIASPKNLHGGLRGATLGCT